MEKLSFDFRSDTVTLPCDNMRSEMFKAVVGDAMFGEDPSVNHFENKLASDLGFAKALFVPSGTMSNQIAIALHTKPGETILGEEFSHFYLYESGATSALSGVQMETVTHFSEETVSLRIRPNSMVHSQTSLMIFENTHNEKGGDARDCGQTKNFLDLADKFKMKKHLDGARIWNAAAATGETVKDLVAGFDSVSVCFSKGLGAPVGSALLLRHASDYDRALHIRKRLGGAMRQVGFLAIAAEYAYLNNQTQLIEDHKKREHAENILKGLGCELKEIGRPTNMVYFKHPDFDSVRLHKSFENVGVGCFLLSGGFIRLVMHRDITLEHLNKLEGVFNEAFNSLKN